MPTPEQHQPAGVEAEDADKVDAAVERLTGGDVDGAERILRDVVSRTPSPYVYREQAGDALSIRFWDIVPLPEGEPAKAKPRPAKRWWQFWK